MTARLNNVFLIALMLGAPTLGTVSLASMPAYAQADSSLPSISLPADGSEPPASSELGASPAPFPGSEASSALPASSSSASAGNSAIDAAAAALAGSRSDASPVTTHSGSNDPCPEPKSALANSPDDLAKVQEDINRFTLCVERAQLLDRLNESAAKTDSTIDNALGFGGDDIPAAGGMMPPGVPTNNMAPVNEAMLGGADVSPTGGAQAIPDGLDPLGGTAPAPPTEWQVREVFGSAGQLYARLNGPKGELVRVRTGDRLPSDGGTVTMVTSTGVTIRKDSDNKTLEWAAQ